MLASYLTLLLMLRYELIQHPFITVSAISKTFSLMCCQIFLLNFFIAVSAISHRNDFRRSWSWLGFFYFFNNYLWGRLRNWRNFRGWRFLNFRGRNKHFFNLLRFGWRSCRPWFGYINWLRNFWWRFIRFNCSKSNIDSIVPCQIIMMIMIMND